MHYQILVKKFHNREKPEHERSLMVWMSLSKSFATRSFLLLFMAYDKHWPFLIFFENSKCLYKLSDRKKKSDTLVFLALNLFEFLSTLSFVALIWWTNSEVLFSSKRRNTKIEASELLLSSYPQRIYSTVFVSLTLFSNSNLNSLIYFY